MTSIILLYFYRFHSMRSIVVSLIRKIEKGDYYSETLRKIFLKYHDIEIGKYSYGCFNAENINRYTRIGRYCSFADGVCIFNANHPKDFISTHPFFFNPTLGYVQEEEIHRRSIDIGNDVWIGKNAIITSSVTKIGNGAIIGAGAVVTKSVPDFSIVAGNPAVIIKYRFDKDTIEHINRMQWWTKDIEDINQRIDDYCKPYNN